MQKRLITAKVVAEITNTTIARTYEAARIGIFPPGVVVRIGRQVRFDEEALREWIRKGGTANYADDKE